MSHVLPVADRIVLLELGRVVRVIDRGEVSVEELQELVARRAGEAVDDLEAEPAEPTPNP